MPIKRRKTKVHVPPSECPLQTCMDVLGGAWTAHIIWFLSGGPRRFSELSDDIRGISPKVLTSRLRRLFEDGVVSRTVRTTSPPTVEYALTDLGLELCPAIVSIVEVGHKLKTRTMTMECL